MYEYATRKGRIMTEINKYTISNNLIELTILNIGASIYELKYKDTNVVLNYDDLELYKENPICLGAIVGRVAGRISNSKFELNGKTYELDNNESNYSIHGGYTNLTKAFWDITKINDTNSNPYIILLTKLNDGDSGYPGNVEISVKYILVSSTLRLEIFAKTDEDTLVNITNHSYFNLNVDKSKSIKNHELMINSNQILEAADNCVPINKLDNKNTDFDLNNYKSLEILDNLTHEQSKKFGGYDHTFLLNGEIPHAIIRNDKIEMEVTTSYPSIVVYSGNAIGQNYNISNTNSYNHQGICFEAQYEPDFINKDFLPNYILKKGEDLIESIEYNFRDR